MCKTETPASATGEAQSLANTTAKPQKQALMKQSQGALPNSLTFCLFVWAVVQEIMRPSDMRMTMRTGLYVLSVSYFFCDYWLWMLHCFLDRKENLAARIPDIAEFARKFQEHHDFPARLLQENHLGEIDDLVSGVAGMGLLLGYWTSPASKLIVVGVTLWGALGGMNHFCCHALSHGYQVPALFKYGQRWCLLPTSRFHKIHHTAPHEENWSFLNGFGKIYERLYYATGSSYNGLFVMFYTLNPILIQTWLLALGILA